MYKLFHPEIEAKSNKEVMKGLGKPPVAVMELNQLD
jgi:hypothetical protein